MKAEDVRNLKWIQLKNWDDITMTNYNDEGKRFISEKDLDIFVENVFKDICRTLNISIEELLPILKEENKSFYEAKSIHYSKYTGFTQAAEEFKEMKKLFKIPDVKTVPMIPKSDSEITDEKIVRFFTSLSNDRKTELLNELKKLVIENQKTEPEKVLEYFYQLSDIEKFNVMNHLGLFDVKVEFKPR